MSTTFSRAPLAGGAYELRDVVPTTSPSMDIQVSSNFERLLFDAYGRDAGAVRTLMVSLAQSHRFAISGPALAEIRRNFTADAPTNRTPPPPFALNCPPACFQLCPLQLPHLLS